VTSREVSCVLKLRQTMPYTVHRTRLKIIIGQRIYCSLLQGLCYIGFRYIELPPYYIMLLVLNWSKSALDVNKVKYNGKYLCGKISLVSLSCNLVSVHAPNKFIYLFNSICPFRLYVLFSQCRSCDDLRKCFLCVLIIYAYIYT